MAYPAVGVKTVVVTGCSSGIGLSTAELLRTAGWQVVPTARKEEDLAMLRGRGFEPLALDLDSSAGVQGAAEAVLERFGGRIGGLVNNAGYGQPGAMEDITREAMRAQFETNLFGLQELTNCLIPVMRRQGWGRIVNVSSVVGRVALPFMGIYSASKFALEAVSDVLRVELHGSGIAVALVEPGPIATAFGERSLGEAERELQGRSTTYGKLYERQIFDRKAGRKPVDFFRKPPEAVAVKILHALAARRPSRRYTVTLPALAGALSARFLPDALVDMLMRGRLRQIENK